MSAAGSTRDGPAGPQRQPVEPYPQGGSGQRLRLAGLAAVCVGVAALAAAAFVLSYSGIRADAIEAGISRQRGGEYPLLIDAMLVITLLAVLGLRGAGLPSRIFSWLALLAVLATAAAADVQHATGHVLGYNVAATTAAVLPWALVFIAFVLLLALLRHARLRRHTSLARRRAAPGPDPRPAVTGQLTAARQAPPLPRRVPNPWNSASIVPGFSSRLVSSAAAGAAAGAAAARAADAPAEDAAQADNVSPANGEPDSDDSAPDAPPADNPPPDNPPAGAAAASEAVASEAVASEAVAEETEARRGGAVGWWDLVSIGPAEGAEEPGAEPEPASPGENGIEPGEPG